MPDTSQFLAWFLAAPVALAAAWLIAAGAKWLLWQAGNAVSLCEARLNGWQFEAAGRASRREGRKAFLAWLAAQAGTAEPGGAVDYELVEAQRQGELVRFLVEREIPKAITRCLDTHRLVAQVTGACHFSEIAYEPECWEARAHVVWLLAHGVEFLHGYPLRLRDARLLHNSVVLGKRALPTCRNCPYIEQPVEGAPPLCPSAELVQVRNAAHDAKR